MDNQPSLWRRPLVLTVITITSLMMWGLIVAVAFAQLPPPVAYRNAVRASVLFESPRNVRGFCAMLTQGALEDVSACSAPGYMILPNPCDGRYRRDEYAALVCHEMGHVNGFEGE